MVEGGGGRRGGKGGGSVGWSRSEGVRGSDKKSLGLSDGTKAHSTALCRSHHEGRVVFKKINPH